ncbi:24127_t:CDS:2 [Gigaspora margarita]|uniref:24127_t:CDS:1 n=1 Tax=Gigaspora margarita TaxID=4874 RepID=A0ABN7UU33_GIGMA|nr:24127_t:CDS:2 [Gigaspora margarita]
MSGFCNKQIKEKSKAGNPGNALQNKLQIQENNNIDIVKEKNIENFNRLKIGVHNINGLRLDEEKLLKNKIDIIGITETNIEEKEGK